MFPQNQHEEGKSMRTLTKIGVFSLGILMMPGVLFAVNAPIPFLRYQQLVQPIVKNMTLNQKLGQMTLPKLAFLRGADNKIDPSLIRQYHLGALLAAGGEIPDGKGGVIAAKSEAKDYLTSTTANWQKLMGPLSQQAVVVMVGTQAVKIPLLFGIDAVHGNQSVLGNVLFPQNMALSMTHNPELLQQVEYFTAAQLRKDAFNWAFAPTVAVSHNPDWGRNFETLGSVPALIKRDAKALVQGLQQDNGRQYISGVLATAKHFLGDGATLDGIDEGNDDSHDLPRLIAANAQGYYGAIASGVGSVMVSYSAINGVPMSINKALVTDELRNKEGFRGLAVSDYGAVNRAANQFIPNAQHPLNLTYPQALAKAVNAGLDVFMLSSVAKSYTTVPEFQSILKQDVVGGKIKMSTIDQAVTRILAVKYAMGLIHVTPHGHWQSNVRPNFPGFRRIYHGSAATQHQAEVDTATKAAEQSFVLLKNQNKVLPLSPEKIKYVILLGEEALSVHKDDGSSTKTLFANYNNVGAENGGWTVAWQGVEGNLLWRGKNKKTSAATTLAESLKRALPKATFLYPLAAQASIGEGIVKNQKFVTKLKQSAHHMNTHNTVIINTMAEVPYAELMGDINNPYCRDNSHEARYGCLYNGHYNAYLPNQQKSSLQIGFDPVTRHVLKMLASKEIPLVSILLSGRPMIIDQGDNPLARSQAFIAAWLPGTSGGQALANALLGKYIFCGGTSKNSNGQCHKNSANTLTVDWPRSMTSLGHFPVYGVGRGVETLRHPLFGIGYGLAG
jgi:beta-glucosidase